ncbi:hypothetical protein D3C87_1835920 [compost metagenome]
MILFNSSEIRSIDTMLMRSFILVIASNVSGSISKLSWLANRIARIMRSGSSEKVISGSSGVRIILLRRSLMPSNGSTSSPKVPALRLIPIALMVKSRRFWSSANVPSSTAGLRESER